MTSLPASTPLRRNAGSVLFRPGEACAGFIRLLRGSIKVSLTSPSGREVVLYRVAPGGLCLQTMSCLINGGDYAAEGIAETEIEGEFLPAAEFQRLLGADERFRNDILAAVAERFHEYERLVEEVALTGFDARLARVLLRLADGRATLETTHEALAAETASGRAFVSRRLAEFERDGLLVRRRGAIEILDPPGLGRIAAEAG